MPFFVNIYVEASTDVTMLLKLECMNTTYRCSNTFGRLVYSPSKTLLDKLPICQRLVST